MVFYSRCLSLKWEWEWDEVRWDEVRKTGEVRNQARWTSTWVNSIRHPSRYSFDIYPAPLPTTPPALIQDVP